MDFRPSGPTRIPFWGVILVALLTSTGCSERSDPGPVLARVGKAELTLRDLREALPPEVLERTDRQELIEFANAWIRSELLHQAARDMGYARDPRVRERLAEATRSILVEVFLEDELEVGALISDTEVETYYANNQDTFRRSADEVRVAILWFADTASANRAREAILGGRTFEEMAADTAFAALASDIGGGYVTAGELGEELGPTILRQEVGTLPRPVRIGTTYVVMRVEERQEAGSVRALWEVREDIVARMAADLREIKMEQILSRLLEKAEVSVDVDAALRELRRGGER